MPLLCRPGLRNDVEILASAGFHLVKAIVRDQFRVHEPAADGDRAGTGLEKFTGGSRLTPPVGII